MLVRLFYHNVLNLQQYCRSFCGNTNSKTHLFYVLVWAICIMNGSQLDSITLKLCNEPCLGVFDMADCKKKEQKKKHSVIIYEKMPDTHPHSQGHLLENMLERSPALINCVPARDKDRRGNMVKLVLSEDVFHRAGGGCSCLKLHYAPLIFCVRNDYVTLLWWIRLLCICYQQ